MKITKTKLKEVINEELEKAHFEAQLLQENGVEEGLVEEGVLADLAAGIVALLGTKIGRRMIAWALRVPEKLASAVMDPMRKWSRPKLEAKLGADSKTLELVDWWYENIGAAGPQGWALGKLAVLVEGLDDSDAEELTSLVGHAQIAEQELVEHEW